MDVFDEFEMKPLTDGLGFHRKKEKIANAFDEVRAVENGDLLSSVTEKVPHKSIDRATEALDKLMDSLNTLDKQGITFTETLPSKSDESVVAKKINETKPIKTLKRPSIHPNIPTNTPRKIKTPEVINETIEKVKSEMDGVVSSMSSGTRRGSSDSLVGNLKELSVSIPSAILDAIVVFSISLLFIVGMLIATESSLDTLLYSINQDMMTQISLGLLYLVVLQIYVVSARCLAGATLGEWTFDCQMGMDSEIKQSYYPLQNIWRSILMIGTGLVLLPIISLIVNKDLARYLTGLQLYKRAY